MKNKILTADVLNTMTREEVRRLATHLNIPRGKEKKHTVANLVKAAEEGKLMVKSVLTIFAPPSETSPVRKTLYMKKFRTYKEDKVLFKT